MWMDHRLLLLNVCVVCIYSLENSTQKRNMPPPQGAVIDPDADFVYDYHTLRVVGLSVAGVIVLLSILLLTGKKFRHCLTKSPDRQDSDTTLNEVLQT
nr:phospholemman-like [Syngnathus scovelli]